MAAKHVIYFRENGEILQVLEGAMVFDHDRFRTALNDAYFFICNGSKVVSIEVYNTDHSVKHPTACIDVFAKFDGSNLWADVYCNSRYVKTAVLAD